MSRHTGIDPKEKTIDITELNLADKKYVDDKDNLRLEISGGAMTGPLEMSGGKIWDLGDPTLDSNATNKKYVDDEITTLTSTVNNKISDIDVIDESYSVVNAEQTTYANLNSTRSEIRKLESSFITNVIEKHFHVSYSGQRKGFGFTSGRALIAWGGFGSIDGRATFALMKLRGMGWGKITKIQLLRSVDTNDWLQGANISLTDALTGSFGNGTFTIPVGHHHFSNMTYLCVYFEGSTALVNIYFDLYI